MNNEYEVNIMLMYRAVAEHICYRGRWYGYDPKYDTFTGCPKNTTIREAQSPSFTLSMNDMYSSF